MGKSHKILFGLLLFVALIIIFKQCLKQYLLHSTHHKLIKVWPKNCGNEISKPFTPYLSIHSMLAFKMKMRKLPRNYGIEEEWEEKKNHDRHQHGFIYWNVHIQLGCHLLFCERCWFFSFFPFLLTGVK